ncbi:MAG: SGNH/GDSL hydrolase family protein [Planctomycetota bacterium]|nr:MAG: SGNH/GDSL hydrolase family protein [Planctomycetota bacterium]
MLFIGNSFTARNDLPGMLTELAAARGLRIEHDLISAGGASLRRHWNAGPAIDAIVDGGYDDVVLQEQSTLPVKNAARMAENVGEFHSVIREAGSRTVLYMTWARRHAPETQAAISKAYTKIGRELGALVVPVGLAWQAFLAEHDHPDLYDRDGSHPSPAGSYLAACVFLAALFGENPVGMDAGPNQLDAKSRELLQRAACQHPSADG